MVITIIALALVPVMAAAAFVGGFFCATKALQIGLRWQGQMNANQVPTMPSEDKKVQPVSNPITPNTWEEWINGAPKPTLKDDE